ncbi:MAG TPA: hypothetical protein VGM91_08765 [Conexibacter sp.]|jgi:mannose-6-phosphate isomerase-like protein (cupin superfamily)
MERTAQDNRAEPRVGAGFACVNLAAVVDSAAAAGYGEAGEARFATRPLGTERIGLGYQTLNPGRRQSFGHRHGDAEEVYLVLGGSGRVRVDDTIVELSALDVIRVAPEAMRCFEGGPEGLQFVAFGTRHENDWEVVPGWWGGSEA